MPMGQSGFNTQQCRDTERPVAEKNIPRSNHGSLVYVTASGKIFLYVIGGVAQMGADTVHLLNFVDFFLAALLL
jgi:hypothetical protein